MMSEARERPILFSGPMVRAILEGTKTQTRRVTDARGADRVRYVENARLVPARKGDTGYTGWVAEVDKLGGENGLHLPLLCPYGVPGDRLWVRETTWKDSRDDRDRIYVATPEWYMDRKDGLKRCNSMGELISREESQRNLESNKFWRRVPAIHMPRWASRITLEITNVRVQRVQEISEEDAKAEGLNQQLCSEILTRAASKLVPEEAFYVTDKNENDVTEGYVCHGCAQKQLKKFKGGHINAAMCPESDSPAYCDKCYVPLFISLTKYGIERELYLEGEQTPENAKYFPATGLDAAIAGMIADGIGDLRNEHLGRLSQIGFATLWDSLNKSRGFGWDANPWVWAITFRRLGHV